MSLFLRTWVRRVPLSVPFLYFSKASLFLSLGEVYLNICNIKVKFVSPFAPFRLARIFAITSWVCNLKWRLKIRLLLGKVGHSFFTPWERCVPLSVLFGWDVSLFLYSLGEMCLSICSLWVSVSLSLYSLGWDVSSLCTLRVRCVPLSVLFVVRHVLSLYLLGKMCPSLCTLYVRCVPLSDSLGEMCPSLCTLWVRCVPQLLL